MHGNKLTKICLSTAIAALALSSIARAQSMAPPPAYVSPSPQTKESVAGSVARYRGAAKSHAHYEYWAKLHVVQKGTARGISPGDIAACAVLVFAAVGTVVAARRTAGPTDGCVGLLAMYLFDRIRLGSPFNRFIDIP